MGYNPPWRWVHTLGTRLEGAEAGETGRFAQLVESGKFWGESYRFTMGSLSFAEIVTIAVVILIIFGPDRLPEFARKIGKLVAKARQATSQLAEEISGEWREAADPVRQARDDYEGIKDDLRQAGAVFSGLGDNNLSGSDPNRMGYEPAPRVDDSQADELPADELPVDELPVDEFPIDEPVTDDTDHGEPLP